jgi:hypothetical protein
MVQGIAQEVDRAGGTRPWTPDPPRWLRSGVSLPSIHFREAAGESANKLVSVGDQVLGLPVG